MKVGFNPPGDRQPLLFFPKLPSMRQDGISALGYKTRVSQVVTSHKEERRWAYGTDKILNVNRE